MPLYAFACEQCAHAFEELQPFSAPPPACPACGGPSRRALSGFQAGPARREPSTFTPAQTRRDRLGHRHHH